MEKDDDDEFPDIGTKLQILTLKRENMKLQKRIAKLEAENVTLQNSIKVLKKRAEGNHQNPSFFKEKR
ncbi:MAG: hypothetical protein ACXWMH_09250 [Syntrophales bacterium]